MKEFIDEMTRRSIFLDEVMYFDFKLLDTNTLEKIYKILKKNSANKCK
jgi:hypothetical protein